MRNFSRNTTLTSPTLLRPSHYLRRKLSSQVSQPTGTTEQVVAAEERASWSDPTSATSRVQSSSPTTNCPSPIIVQANKSQRLTLASLPKGLTLEAPDDHTWLQTNRRYNSDILDVFVTRNPSFITSIFCFSALFSDNDPVVIKVARTPNTSPLSSVRTDFLHMSFLLEKWKIQMSKLQTTKDVDFAVSRLTEATERASPFQNLSAENSVQHATLFPKTGRKQNPEYLALLSRSNAK